jgi:hypothetical protein
MVHLGIVASKLRWIPMHVDGEFGVLDVRDMDLRYLRETLQIF